MGCEMSPLERMKATRLCQQLKAQPTDCSPEEWFQLALDSEQTARDCGFGDPATTRFQAAASAYMEMAALAERQPGQNFR